MSAPDRERMRPEKGSPIVARIRRAWPVVRRIWITLGISLTVIFIAWSLIAYRASSEARRAAVSDSGVVVDRADGLWHFTPQQQSGKVARLVFFPGALVDPRAYAPLARAVASAGYPVTIVELPRRGVFGGATSSDLNVRTAAAFSSGGDESPIVVGGHSRGAVVASTIVGRDNNPAIGGLALIGTSHPRDTDLSGATIPITKIVGSRDGLASREEVEQNAHLLPDHTRWVRIEGGNHSQFGWYGFQPMDRRPHVSASVQRRIMIEAVLDLMRDVDNSEWQQEGQL